MNVVAFQTKADGKWENEQWVLPTKKEDMFKDFEGWGENVQKILSVSFPIPKFPSHLKIPVGKRNTNMKIVNGETRQMGVV